ncbi:MAG: phosphate signaling complex protein PhoU [Anaerolineales bacterium]|jgi:phosphate transport system protein
MTREMLDQKIKDLKADVVVLGSMVQEATLKAVEALRVRDLKASKKIYKKDKKINRKRFEIESDCLIVIATQQPLARDLRVLSSVIEVITELERMGDYAKGIARINMMIGDEELIKPLIDIPKMAKIATEMLAHAIQAFVDEDADAARKIPREDEEVDVLFNQVYRDLIELMAKDPSGIVQSNHLQWAAHNIERMADRVTNICERTIFIATGEMHELEETDDEWSK